MAQSLYPVAAGAGTGGFALLPAHVTCPEFVEASADVFFSHVSLILNVYFALGQVDNVIV